LSLSHRQLAKPSTAARPVKAAQLQQALAQGVLQTEGTLHGLRAAAPGVAVGLHSVAGDYTAAELPVHPQELSASSQHRYLRMSRQSPLPLFELAKQSLLKRETIASTALHGLPSTIFHDLFMDAFMGERNEVLKMMVQAWPYPYLPLRSLMVLIKRRTPHTQLGETTLQERNLRTLESLLDGADTQLSLKVHHRTWKLQVLDWRDVHLDFWTAGPRAMSVAHSAEARKKEMGKPGLRYLSPGVNTSPSKNQSYSHIYALHLGQLESLRELHMDALFFLEGTLHKILRCLKCPLETLSLRDCQLSQDDWNQLPQSEQTRQLKYMGLIRIRLTDFSPEPLRILLDNVAATLTTLRLENCGITDAQVCAFLPSLSCCSQLTTFCFIRNFISIATMKKLLGHTARLRSLNRELYSVPQEIYVPRDGTLQQMWNEVQEALREMMKPLNHPRTILFCVSHDVFRQRVVYSMHPNPCPACIPI
ncbi:PREDICTED: LOW QUALITY PROTEIN: melanoma antigen preferentially expressed in tumors-like, partial [Chinchilla lanigera]|uniref:LOW QUALITY PROTEIN: melanoma antigen preferentially expressed in tumors-like n=1 Tax=Chinchilla lanigera TaxID=34839 RepID=UPI000696DD24